MSIKRLLTAFKCVLLAGALVTCSYAQSRSDFNGPSIGGDGFGQNGLRMGPSARPFGEPESLFDEDYYNYDAQIWHPNDVVSLDGHDHVPTGVYFAFERAYLSLDRAEAQFQPNVNITRGAEWQWGNKYQLGYMGESGSGFNLSWLYSEGNVLTDGQAPGVQAPNWVNTKYNVVELNRVFRQMLSHGGYIEPYFGLRYNSLNDNTTDDITAAGLRFMQRVSNSGFGGQLGGRYVRAISGRARFHFDGSVAAMYNAQDYFATNLVDPTGGNVFVVQREVGLSGNDFVPVLDIESGFEIHLTRDISLRTSGTLIWNWNGMVRANTARTTQNPYNLNSGLALPTDVHTEDLLTAGVLLGIDWRR